MVPRLDSLVRGRLARDHSTESGCAAVAASCGITHSRADALVSPLLVPANIANEIDSTDTHQ